MGPTTVRLQWTSCIAVDIISFGEHHHVKENTHTMGLSWESDLGPIGSIVVPGTPLHRVRPLAVHTPR